MLTVSFKLNMIVTMVSNVVSSSRSNGGLGLPKGTCACVRACARKRMKEMSCLGRANIPPPPPVS